MPKKKSNKKTAVKKAFPKKQFKSDFKFDIKQIVEERQAEKEFWKKSDELDKQIKSIDVWFQEHKNQTSDNFKKTQTCFDCSKYNITFEEDSDIRKSCLRRLSIMLNELNELEAITHFKYLMKANWSPLLDDIKTIFCHWGADLDTLINKPPIKSPLNDSTKYIERHNFELVMNFLSHSVMNEHNEFSNNDLLTLAKLTLTIYFDCHYGEMIDAIQELFSACIEKAFHYDDDSAVITFGQELYSQLKNDNLSNMIIDLFLPLKGDHTVMKKLYSYLTFKFYLSLLDKNSKEVFPSNFENWYVQDLVNKNYFKQNATRFCYIVRLMEHIVIVFDLYRDKKKLKNMYDFFYYSKNHGRLSLKLVNILDQWKLKLLRLSYIDCNN